MFFSKRYVYRHPLKRLLAGCFDLAGGVLFFPWKRRGAGEIPPESVKRVLVIRLDHVGDVLMTRPAAKALRAHYPHAQIDWLIAEASAPILKNCWNAGEVITARHSWFERRQSSFLGFFVHFLSLRRELLKRRYDAAVDFRGDLRNILLMFFSGIRYRIAYGITGGQFLLTHVGSYRPGLHQAEQAGALLNTLHFFKPVTNFPVSYPPERKESFLKKQAALFAQSSRDRRVLIHPAAGYPSKEWPWESYRELMKRLTAEGFTVILIGTEEERKCRPLTVTAPGVWDLRGQTGCSDLPVLFDQCVFFIGNDSGPAHLAAAQGLPGLVLFSGTNDPKIWRPFSDRLDIVSHDVPCAPCGAEICPLNHHDCMKQLTVDTVWARVRAKLSESADAVPSSQG